MTRAPTTILKNPNFAFALVVEEILSIQVLTTVNGHLVKIRIKAELLNLLLICAHTRIEEQHDEIRNTCNECLHRHYAKIVSDGYNAS